MPSPTFTEAEPRGATASAVYPAVLAEAAGVRSRAQSAFAITSAITAAVVVAGVLGDIEEFPAIVRVVGVLAALAWFASAGFFVSVARRVTTVPRDAEGKLASDHELAGRALDVATTECEELGRRLRRAAMGCYAALVLTGAALVLALVLGADNQRTATLVLSREGRAALSAECPDLRDRVSGDLHVDTLDDGFAVIDVPSDCGPEKTLRIQPAHITATFSTDR